MTSGKSMAHETNELLRAAARALIDRFGNQERAAKELGVSQSFLNDFLRERRGAGAKLLIGLARLAPKAFVEAMRLDTVLDAEGEEVFDLPQLTAGSDRARESGFVDAPSVDAEAEAVAYGIMIKRGWTAAEIAAGKRRATVLSLADAEDPVALADAWELPLRGRHQSSSS